jgi:CRISPR-associated endonuclease/helicase Cas3
MYNLFDIDLRKIQAYAHSRKNYSEKEPFYEHSERCIKYYNRIISDFGLNPILEGLIKDVDSDLHTVKIYPLLREIVKFHDIGKLTTNFQKKLDGEKNSETHSDKGFFILTYNFLYLSKVKKITGKEFLFILIMLYAVYKHHGSLNNLLEDLASFRFSASKSKSNEVFQYLNITPDHSLIELMEEEAFWDRWQTPDIKSLITELSTDSLSLFILIKLFFSILTASDYYATLEYMEGNEFYFECLNDDIFKAIWENYHHKKELKGELNFNVIDIDQHRSELRQLSIEDISQEYYSDKATALNKLRSKINVEAEDSLEKLLSKEKDSNVYLLNVPTGGGKTNLSLRLALTIMEKRDIHKLFYVFPFINIIEQSFDGLEKFIGIDNMVRLDSRYIDSRESDDLDNSTLYVNYINNLFFNKPVLFLSHVKFFDLFFRNDKTSNYNFFQLANSVVIIDEIQAYDDQVWTEVSEVLHSIGRFLNTHFIVMSATLPDFQQLTTNAKFSPILDKGVTLRLFNHPLFKRTEILPDTSISRKSLKKVIIACIEQSKKILVVLNTVSDSFDLYSELIKEKRKNLKRFDILLLNSTIVENRRKEILEKCKEDSKIILIATQSVEAGVDIDFDIGFRAYAPIDSIVQVAGRINRNNKKGICRLYVFKDDDFTNVYSSGYKSIITRESKDCFFKKRSFDEYKEVSYFYHKSIEKIIEDNKTKFLKSSRENIIDMRNLFFKNINNNVHLINGDTISLFIPYEKEAVELWKTYIELLENPGGIEKIAKIKAFRKKMLPYVVNLFNSFTKAGKLRNVLNKEMQYGFYYCEDWKNYFEYKSGIDVKKFKNTVVSERAVFL